MSLMLGAWLELGSLELPELESAFSEIDHCVWLKATNVFLLTVVKSPYFPLHTQTTVRTLLLFVSNKWELRASF